MKNMKVFTIGLAIIAAFCFGKALNNPLQAKHPHMNAAKLKLEEAKNQLQKAEHDYNGHRTKAVGLVEQAIKEINEGIAAEKK
jgi:hypothetical protein